MADDLEFEDEGNETLGEEFGNGFSVHYDVYPIILAVLIVVANGTALILVLRRKKLQTVTNGILASLAVSDLLAGLAGVPLYLACNLTGYSPPWCLSSAAFWRFVSVSTVLHLTVLTMHLFAAVVHAARYEFLLKQRASVCLVCACWICAAIVSLIQLSWIGSEDDSDDEVQHKLRIHHVYSIAVLIMFLGVPLVTMVYCYTRIFAFVRLYERERKAGIKKDGPLASNWKAAVVFAGMLAVFLICWAPYFILELMEDDGAMESLPLWAVYLLFYYTRFTASAINPVLFVLGKRDFRSALCECLGCCRTPKKDEGANRTLHSLV